MNNSVSRDEILKRIRKAKTVNPEKVLPIPDMKSPIYKEIEPSKVLCFKNELEAVSGVCMICQSFDEIAQKIKQLLIEKEIDSVFCKDMELISFLGENKISSTNDIADFDAMEIGLTGCEFLVARTGSVIISSQGESGRKMNIFPPIHLVIAKKEQIVNYPEDGLVAMQAKYGKALPSLISFVSGPSRTADIEKTLVLGAHGPKELYVFIKE